MARVYYDYPTFRTDLKTLAEKLPDDFDALIAVARGGMTMAHLLGEYLNIRHVYAVNAIGYDDTCKLDTLQVFNLPDMQTARKALIVDDIADSGETLKAVAACLKRAYPAIAFQTATLFYKPEKSAVEPDYWVKEAHDEWIDFFWSEDLKSASFVV